MSFLFCQNDSLLLWPDQIPNIQKSAEVEIREKGDIFWIRKVQEPSLEIYLPTPQQATGRAIIICPGGGYTGLAFDWEGIDIAKWLNSKGIAAFVLKYRLPDSKSIIKSYEAPFQDAQRAIRMVRFHSDKWKIKKDQIGVLGFSAGGHLASTLGTQFETENSIYSDSIDMVYARPDFMMLIYPVITMKKGVTHQGSMETLLGKNPSKKLIEQYSNELQVTKNTPPTFIIHSADDEAVPVENSLLFFSALNENNIPVEMHIYPSGGHGYSLAIGQGNLQTWTNRLEDWLESLEKIEE